MKIQPNLQNAPVNQSRKRPQTPIATGLGIAIRDKVELSNPNPIQKNNPENPLVSKKILDALDLGLIDFTQDERDAIAKIMMGRSKRLSANKPKASS